MTSNTIPDAAVEAAWFEPHASQSCDVFSAPHADCDCGAEIP